MAARQAGLYPEESRGSSLQRMRRGLQVTRQNTRVAEAGPSFLLYTRLLTRAVRAGRQVEFPERAGALARFLAVVSPAWNVTLFHYRRTGAARALQRARASACVCRAPNDSGHPRGAGGLRAVTGLAHARGGGACAEVLWLESAVCMCVSGVMQADGVVAVPPVPSTR